MSLRKAHNMTEKQKMIAGHMYDPLDPVLDAERHQARLLFQQINSLNENQKPKRNQLFKELFGPVGKDLWIEPPFYCDYGYNISGGDNLFMNFDCCILDVCPVRFGDRVMLGPGVHIYTASHPLEAEARSSGVEFGKPVSIGSNVWIGGGAIICPGVTIGNGVVVGAGAVVTKDVPDHVFIGGNPARIIKHIVQ